jgi:HJR/Mrr/RecB family endonuclease
MHGLFRSNPKRFDLASLIERGDRPDDWAMNQGRSVVSPGDHVFFWQTGPEARLLAVGRVTSPVYERESDSFGRYRVDVSVDFRISPPLTRPEVLHNEILGMFAPFKWAMGTNIPIEDPVVVAELDSVLASRLIPLSDGLVPNQLIEDSQHSLDAAIKRARNEAVNKIRQHIAQMDPIAFEWLVRALVLKLGYKDVSVTKASGDSGVDVRATLVAGGIANMPTCIQVKRQPSVGRPIVQKIRGSLSAHEAGLLVTSGEITEEAREEAKDPRKVPIALIDGTKLTELLLAHQIGVEHVTHTLYRLKLEELSKEWLEAVVEESDESAS